MGMGHGPFDFDGYDAWHHGCFFWAFFLGPRHFTKQRSSFESRRLACTVQRSSRKHRRLQLDLRRICTEFEVWWKFDVLQGLLIAMTCNWPCQCDVCVTRAWRVRDVCVTCARQSGSQKRRSRMRFPRRVPSSLGGWSPSVTLRFSTMGWECFQRDDLDGWPWMTRNVTKNKNDFGHGWRSRLRIERWKMGKMGKMAPYWSILRIDLTGIFTADLHAGCESYSISSISSRSGLELGHVIGHMHSDFWWFLHILQEQPKPSRLATDTAWTAGGKGPSEIWLL